MSNTEKDEREGMQKAFNCFRRKDSMNIKDLPIVKEDMTVEDVLMNALCDCLGTGFSSYWIDHIEYTYPECEGSYEDHLMEAIKNKTFKVMVEDVMYSPTLEEFDKCLESAPTFIGDAYEQDVVDSEIEDALIQFWILGDVVYG